MYPGYSEAILSIKGTPTSALVGSTLAFFTGFAPLAVFGPTVAKAPALSNFARAMLLASPTLTGSVLRLPAGANVDNTGGRRFALSMLAASNIGMLGLTALAFTTDLESLTAAKPEYYAWLAAGAAAGSGIAVFPSGVGNTTYWNPRNESGKKQGIFGGVGNLAPGIFALSMPLVMNAVGGANGVANTYVIWFALLAVETLATSALFINPPFHQLVHNEKNPVPPNVARLIAADLGEEHFPPQHPSTTIGVLKQFKKDRNKVLVGAYFVSFGGFMAATIMFHPAYKEQGLSLERAGIVTAAYSITSSLTRAATGGLADKYGGGIITNIGMAGIMIAGAALALSEDPLSALDITGLIALAVGGGLANAAVYKWIASFKEDVGSVGGLVGALGAMGGFIIPLILSGIDELGGVGYGMFTYTALAAAAILANIWLMKQRPAVVMDIPARSVSVPVSEVVPAASLPLPLYNASISGDVPVQALGSELRVVNHDAFVNTANKVRISSV
ncbi:MAG: MFS transporter [Francisellaceae bacterium]|jgi:MFS transporter, NNP family, nitrate/nitrite transporter|nr:MFS transporter [Francisellaceae bacterium]MBT6207642.1 MFS transporter [Francisellaceae bacterium]MBT6538431.1 MFS transporter [Francisellaceae bacterium]